jgi:hypothetical protein
MSHLKLFSRAARLLAAALLLAVLAVVPTPRPVAAHTTPFYVHLISLKCFETEDWSGADEPFLIVGNSRVWSGSLNNGKTADLTHIPAIQFYQQIEVALYDDDSPDDDDWLGEGIIYKEQSYEGIYSLYFNYDGANYRLTYQVTAER